MRILLVDTETTGLDPETSHIWEVGAMIVNEHWQYEGAFKVRMLDDQIASELAERRAELPNLPEIEDIVQTAVSPIQALAMLNQFIIENNSQHNPLPVFAYNAKFDRAHVHKAYERYMPSVFIPACFTGEWFCAMEHLPSNYRFKCWKLGHIALDYGIAVNPAELHGAYEDVCLMRQLLEKSGHTPQEVIAFANEPWIVLRAITEAPWKDNGVSNKLAQSHGYTWQKPRGYDKSFDKCWVKRVKQSAVDTEIKKAEGLQIVVIKE